MNRITIILLFTVFFLLFILSVCLYSKHKKIKEKYNVGYISSFFFVTYMLFPVLMLMFYPLNGMEFKLKIEHLLLLIYPLIGMGIFLFVYRKERMRYKAGKFFAMLAVGVCSAFLLVFKMLEGFNKYENRSMAEYDRMHRDD